MVKLVKSIAHWYFNSKTLPFWCMLLLDCFFVAVSGFIATYITRTGALVNNLWPNTLGILATVCVYMVFFRIFHTYSGIVRFSTFRDLVNMVIANSLSSVSAYVISKSLRVLGIKVILMPSLLGLFIMFMFTTLCMGIVRMQVKSLFESYRAGNNSIPVFIYGVLEGGISIAKSISNQMPAQYKVAGFVSPTGDFVGQHLLGVKVFPNDANLVDYMADSNAKVLYVSPLQTDAFRENQSLLSALVDNDIKIMVVSGAEEWDGKSPLSHERMHEVQIEDLLPREKIEVDMNAIGRNLRGRRILITGAAGSIGSEMVRQIAVYQPAEMVLIDQAETPMHDIRLLMANRFPSITAYTIVGSITNREFMESLFAVHRPQYVLHAAAYKHVPMMEDNPAMAVQNNIAGTRIMADLSVKYGVEKFVMISTDKAVNPTNVMGCSKRICEIYCQSLNQAIVEGRIKGVTQFVTTRFGNVLGSNGSVIPLFREQIRKGGPVTVTHPDIIRYFMLIPEACKLVLEAGTMGKGGEIYVFDMGKPVKIVDLARRMIRLSGAKDIEIKFTGLRDGEKLFEEVLSDAETTIPTSHPKIMTAKVREYDYVVALENEQRLMEASYSFDDMEIVKIMKEIVPEYKSRCSKYEALDAETPEK